MKRMLWLNTLFLLGALLAACGGTAPTSIGSSSNDSPSRGASLNRQLRPRKLLLRGKSCMSSCRSRSTTRTGMHVRKGMEARAEGTGCQS